MAVPPGRAGRLGADGPAAGGRVRRPCDLLRANIQPGRDALRRHRPGDPVPVVHRFAGNGPAYRLTLSGQYLAKRAVWTQPVSALIVVILRLFTASPQARDLIVT